MSETNTGKLFQELADVIARLRGPQGCPWDRKQTHSSLKEYLLEETYEVLEALDQENHRELSGELGDLLLQILLHSEIARESGDFNIDEVIKGITAKLIRRHPHVFGNTAVTSAEEVTHN